MAEEQREFTKLEIDGKEYSLTYDFDSIVAAEEATGLELLIGVNWARIKAKRIRAMLYASMLPAHPDVTLAEAGKLITVPNLPKIETALVDAWMKKEPLPAEQASAEAA